MKFIFVVCSLSASYVFKHSLKRIAFLGYSRRLYLSLSLLHAHTHTHTCTRTHMLAETKTVPTQTLPKQCSPTDKSLPSQGSKYLCHMAGVGWRALHTEIHPACQSWNTIVRRAFLIHEQSGEMPTLDCQHQGPFLKVTSETSSRMVWRTLCQETHLITGGNTPG